MNSNNPTRKRNWVLTVIVPLVAGAAMYYMYDYYTSNDSNTDVTTGTSTEPHVYNETPASENNWNLEWYNDVIYFEDNSFFDGDSWVWIDATGCPVADETSPWTLAWREPRGDDFSYADQIGFVNSNWKPVHQEFSSSKDVGMIAVSPTEFGFRLPDGSDDVDLEAFADRLDTFLREHDPCPKGASVPADV